MYSANYNEYVERERARAAKVRSAFSMPGASGSDFTTLRDPDPARWMESHFYIPETKGPIELASYQRDVLRTAFPDSTVELPYSTVVWSDIKKSIKSTVAAAVCLWWAFQVDNTDGWGSLYIIANDLKQADSRVFYYVRRAIQLNPTLRERCNVKLSGYRVTLPNQTFIEAIPIDPTGEAGSNADAVFYSELWGAHSSKQQQMWTESTLPPNKYGRSFRWVESYAGYTGGAPILEQLYEQTVKTGRRLRGDLELFDNPDGRMLTLWNTTPRLSWQTDAYYDQERAMLLPKEFDRVHRNQWSDGSATPFLPDIALWDACRDDALPPLGRHERCVLAIDAGESNDCFAWGVVSRHPHDANRTAVRLSRIYTPRWAGDILDFDTIEMDIRDLAAQYAIVLCAFDRMLLGQFLRRFQQRFTTLQRRDADGNTIGKPVTYGAFPVPLEQFSQGTARLESDKNLYDLITTRRFAHDGKHDTLRQHIANADQKLDAHGRMRIVKRAQTLKIDGAVMLGMACAVVATRTIEPPTTATLPFFGGATRKGSR